jgi:hypothetical protein
LARGFDSKSVSDQQEEAERRRERTGGAAPESPRRRQLEMARLDVLRRLEKAPDNIRQTLQAALDAIDHELKGS